MTSGAPFKIGKYDVVDVIGRGGMGVVYRAKDQQLGRLVAIKMMTASIGEDPELVQRFFREARSTASLQHPNIVTVYELGDYSGNPYLAMEYLEGCSLDAILTAGQPLNLVEKLGILVEVCQGLGYAHQRQVIHRDIKPGNIMVLPNGAVKLVDFGIAHIIGKKVTLPGQVIGSFNYMSPEQINSKPLDARTDIFSAGIVLYQLLSNSLPFEAPNTAATLFGNRPRPHRGAGAVHDDLRRTVLPGGEQSGNLHAAAALGGRQTQAGPGDAVQLREHLRHHRGRRRQPGGEQQRGDRRGDVRRQPGEHPAHLSVLGRDRARRARRRAGHRGRAANSVQDARAAEGTGREGDGDDFGPDRMIWGYFGLDRAGFDKEIELFEIMFDKVSEADKEKIRGGTALKLFGWRK